MLRDEAGMGVGSRAATSNQVLSPPQPVHSPSPTGLCGVGPAASPGPLLSPGSSSDSNGGDAEGPGPPAPVSVPPLLCHLVWRSPVQARFLCLSLPVVLTPWPQCLPTGALRRVVPWARDTALFRPAGDLPADL